MMKEYQWLLTFVSSWILRCFVLFSLTTAKFLKNKNITMHFKCRFIKESKSTCIIVKPLLWSKEACRNESHVLTDIIQFVCRPHTCQMWLRIEFYRLWSWTVMKEWLLGAQVGCLMLLIPTVIYTRYLHWNKFLFHRKTSISSNVVWYVTLNIEDLLKYK